MLLQSPDCANQLRDAIQHTLAPVAPTWAPLRLPIDRVVVAAGAGFPALGKVDVYKGFPQSVRDGRAAVESAEASLVVVTLGVCDGDRELEPVDVAGALATQIAAVIADRYPRRSIVTTSSESEVPSPARPVGTRATMSGAQPAAKTATTVKAGTTKSTLHVSELPARASADDESEEACDTFAEPTLSANGQSH
jgi:hypothetical protein